MCIQKLNTIIYSSCIHNNLKLATTQMSINKEMDKQAVIYPCSEIIFSNEKKQVTNINHNITFKNTMPCERNKTQKNISFIISFI